MNNEEIIKSLQEQLGQPIINRKKVEESKLHIKEYIELIPKYELIEILEKYGLDEKKIKRLCK